MESKLSTKNVAALFNKDERTIRRWAESGKLQAESILNEFNSPEYLFPGGSLPPDIQEKYFYQWKSSLAPPPPPPVAGRQPTHPPAPY